MSERQSLVRRRKELVALSELQRAELAAQAQTLRYSMTPSSIGSSLLETVCQHKLLAIGGALVLAFIKPRRLLAGVEAGLAGWTMWKNAEPIFQKVREYFSKA